tara:strand:- start:360 stop:473 length:114 start_codon:yes stop_codon:yes gene_type:complete
MVAQDNYISACRVQLIANLGRDAKTIGSVFSVHNNKI